MFLTTIPSLTTIKFGALCEVFVEALTFNHEVGSLDLRNIGTGNTVTLLNGRRLVQTPGYSTEWVGGSYVPVNSVNSNTIPVYGAERVEILRDGAAAIYGADAVAGVINTVLKSDYEGATVK